MMAHAIDRRSDSDTEGKPARYRRFEGLFKGLLSVPKEELEKQMKKYREEKKRPKAG